MTEKEVEKYLVHKAYVRSILCRKAKWIGNRGCPDRVLMRDGKIVWIEVKGSKGKLSDIQIHEQNRMIAHGQIVVTVYSFEDVDSVFSNVFDV